ncbi:MAG: hypothetical protein ACTSQP_13130 [Promethearchaeota archaeon]
MPYEDKFTFDYIFFNITRTIYKVIYSHENWDIMNKHPNFYITRDPDSTESILLDEIMIIRGSAGIIERSLHFNGTKNLLLDGNEFNTFEFTINETINDNYYR